MGSVEKTPLKLGQLATEKLTQLLQQSVTTMNRVIASDIKKEFHKTFPSTKRNENPSKPKSESNDFISTPINQYTGAKAALYMMTVRKYLMSGMNNPSITRMTLTPEVIQYIISTAIATKNIGLIRLVLCEWIDALDFRALDKYPTSAIGGNFKRSPSQTAACTSSSSKMLAAKSISRISNNNNNVTTPNIPLFLHCLPPDEFDWFSRDRLGTILSMPEACELFSILGMSQCASNIKELYMNVRRKEYWACPPDIMEITANILLQMTKLSVLVMRGACDDYMLKLIGQSAHGLKQLDIAGSHFVTDAGLKSLFFRDDLSSENPATYLMKSFIEKNLKHMNPLVNTLEMLDYSWTNVTSLSRKMVHHLPGAFVFKRVFAWNEKYAYGHHIFLKKKCSLQVKIPSAKQDLDKFEKSMEQFVGIKGAKTLLKFAEQHPWKNCTLYMFQENLSGGNSKFYGIITPSDEEKRVYGIVGLQENVLAEMYSIFPVNLNFLGDSCPKLQVFRGIVTDVWKMSSSVLTELTVLDIFADPCTTKSVLESAPNLRKVRIRILRDCLTDEYIIKPLSTFMCCRTLEELWIAPGTYSALDQDRRNEEDEQDDVEFQWETFNEVQANYYAAEHPPRTNKNRVQDNNNTQDEDYLNDSDSEECDKCQIDDLVLLTSDCIKTIILACQKLTRLGDIAWWTNIKKRDLEHICTELKESKREITFIWENKIFQ